MYISKNRSRLSEKLTHWLKKFWLARFIIFFGAITVSGWIEFTRVLLAYRHDPSIINRVLRFLIASLACIMLPFCGIFYGIALASEGQNAFLSHLSDFKSE